MSRIHHLASIPFLITAIACGGSAPAVEAAATPPGEAIGGQVVPVLDTSVSSTFDAVGTAQPIAEATLSTKLMGSVTAVMVVEGASVASGAPLARIDAADVDAKDAQAAAGIAAAEAVHAEAQLQAVRIRALYVDSAAPKAGLDAVETGLARATAALAAAQAGRAEVSALRGYGVVRAPFTGVVTKRFVDPGDFAAPGAPIVTVQNVSRLRIVATVPAALAGEVRRGAVIRARIEGVDVRATVEGSVPGPSGTYTVNAVVLNPGGRLPSGGAATLGITSGPEVRALLVPAGAVIHEGDLTGVRVVRDGRSELRWVRLGSPVAGHARVLSGLSAGDSVLVPGGER